MRRASAVSSRGRSCAPPSWHYSWAQHAQPGLTIGCLESAAYAGIGATYAFTPKVHVEASVDFSRVKADASAAPNNISSFMSSGIFGF